ENKYWPKEKMNKPRDQFEYDEWCRVGKCLDNALINRDWEGVLKAREVVATRAFMLRVAKREGWSVASEIRDSSDEDPMDVYFQDKLASARQLAKNKRPKVGSSMGSPVSVLTGLLVGFGNVATNQVLPWPVFQQPVQQQFQPVQSGLPPNLLPLQPVQSGFMQNMPQAYSNTVPNQNLYQQSYGSQGSSRPYGYNRFSRQESGGESEGEKGGGQDPFEVVSRILEGNYKTRGVSYCMVGEQNTSFPKERKIVSTAESAKTDQVYGGRIGMGGMGTRKVDEDRGDKSGMQGLGVADSSSMGLGSVVADVPRGTQGSSGTTTSRRDYYSGTIRTERTMQKSSLETISGENRMGEVLIKRANDLAYCAINRSYRKRLVKAQQLFEHFCSWMKKSACSASIDTVKAFLGWLELAGMLAQVYEYLGAIGRMHKDKGLNNPVDDFRIREVVRGIK
ncbi:33959_t:CDS:2, partial [Gigaspora margarita]